MTYAIAAAPRTITAAVVTSRCILLSIITYACHSPWLGQLFLRIAPSQTDILLPVGCAVMSCDHKQDVLAAT